MVFSSLEFLFLFLPVVLTGYYLLPFRFGLKNYWLLVASIVFYAWGEPSFVFVMLVSIAINYVLALLVEGARNRRRVGCMKALLTACIVANLSVIGIYKYLNFVTATLREWFPFVQGVVPQTSFLLPIGISFFTFQALSYVVDVSRGVKAQRNPFLLALYIAMFPQLVAGPIVRYATVCEQIAFRRTTWEMFSCGIVRFVIGLNKKVLLANMLAEVADSAFALKGMSVAMAWLGAVCYTLQIYFDFSGYSDMAIGLGRMFGFSFLENFNYPYVSRTVTEFWRRWHMSLGSWFRDYVYFPLGGSRVSRGRLLVNLAVVWFATGLWHGANWTFILWGCLYGVLIAGEKLSGLVERVERSAPLRCLYQPFTLLMVVLGWVLFRAPTLDAAGDYLKVMFGNGAFFDVNFTFWAREMAVPLVCAMVGSVPWHVRISHPVAVGLGYLLQFVLFAVSISCLVMNSHNPFIYFNF